MIERAAVERILRAACDCKNCGCDDAAVDEVTAALNAKVEPEVTRRVMSAREIRHESHG
jgi:hypothetical protein